jgi:hypothetical protein
MIDPQQLVIVARPAAGVDDAELERDVSRHREA